MATVYEPTVNPDLFPFLYLSPTAESASHNVICSNHLILTWTFYFAGTLNTWCQGGGTLCVCIRIKNVDIWRAGDETGVKQVEMFWNNLSFTNSPVSVCALPEALRANELKTLLPHWTNFEALCLTLASLSSPLCFCWGGHVLQVKKVGWAVWVLCCCQNTRFKDRQQWHGDKECLPVLIFCNTCIFSKTWIVTCSLLWKHSPVLKIQMILFLEFV